MVCVFEVPTHCRKSPARRDVSFKDKDEENLNGCWKRKEKKYLDFIGAQSLSARYFTRILQALGKLNLNVKRKILVFLLFLTHFSKLGFTDPVTTLLNTAATGKTEFKCEKKNACFSAISDTFFQVGFADPVT